MTDSQRINVRATLDRAAAELDIHATCTSSRGDHGVIALAADVRRCSQLIDDQLTEAMFHHDDRQAAAAKPAHGTWLGSVRNYLGNDWPAAEGGES